MRNNDDGSGWSHSFPLEGDLLPSQLAEHLHPFSPAEVGPGQPQFRPVLGTQGLAFNTKNVPFLSVAGSYFGTLKRIKFPSLKDKDGRSGQDGG